MRALPARLISMCKRTLSLARAREILDGIPGIGLRVAEVIMAEIGSPDGCLC